MTFKNGLTERLDELRFTSPRSPSSDSPLPSYSPLSPSQSVLQASFQRPNHDIRANLQRRFTTDAGKLSSWNLWNQQNSQLPGSIDLLSSATHLHKSQLFEKKRQTIEFMREQKKRFEADMKLLELQQEKERLEMDQLARDLANMSGPVSEPTTPPEYREAGFPTSFSRPSRFSTSSVTSSPGIFNIFSPSHVPSPTTTTQSKSTSAQTPHRYSVHSVPGSRRGSEEEECLPEQAQYRGNGSIHRYSMPTTSLGSQIRSPTATATFNPAALDLFNPSKYLFHSEEDRATPKDDVRLPTPDISSYLRMTDPDDKFPTLSRRDDNSTVLSANSDALDLANCRTPVPDASSGHSRYRSSHQSMPQNGLQMFRLEQLGSPPNSSKADQGQPRHSARHSVELNGPYGSDVVQDSVVTTQGLSRPTPLQPSYSMSNLPTVNGTGFNSTVSPPRSHSEHFHQHNASLGRIPANSVANRSTRGSPEREESQQQQQPPPQPPPPTAQLPPSALQVGAVTYGPQLTSVTSASTMAPSMNPTPLTAFQNPYYGYGLPGYIANPMQVNPQAANLNPPNFYAAGGTLNGFRFPEPQPRGVPVRRSGETDPSQLSRFGNVPLEQYQGELYGLCKDQHGCRYLQRKLEERNPEHVQLIFNETHMHVVELMTDPFGNYLCQKLLEYSNDDQRTTLINNAAPQLVKIALNQHGTRALQKMIEFVSTPEQIQTVIRALRERVVDLVQDLNGNHVIQKCLNRLGAEDAQFIYDSVGANCVVVGTHRHGCCVLQRCIDHASGEQRARLIAQITANAFSLVQDPFGNYVVQYILDLSEPHFTEPLCQTFLGNIPPLSKQKFSSNVIEKCLRTAEYKMRRLMVDEMLSPAELEKMLRDSFANYVVQTAMDFADPETRNRMTEAIRPILPSIRQTPHGRRIAGKMAGGDGSGRTSVSQSGQASPSEINSGQLPASMQLPSKPFLYQHNSFPGSIVPPQFNGSSSFSFSESSQFPLVSSTSSVSAVNTSSGATYENGSVLFNGALHQSNSGPTAQGQNLNGYF